MRMQSCHVFPPVRLGACPKCTGGYRRWVTGDRRSEAVQQMLQAVLANWTRSRTAMATHSSLLPDDQRKILQWMRDHSQVTITKFAKVHTLRRCSIDMSPAGALLYSFACHLSSIAHSCTEALILCILVYNCTRESDTCLKLTAHVLK